MHCRKVVIECEWFNVDGVVVIKQLAFFDIVTGKNYLYLFNFPACFVRHAESLRHQAAITHGIPWNKRGNHPLDRIHYITLDIASRLGVDPNQLCFWTKSSKYADVLAQFGIIAVDMNLLNCPRLPELDIFATNHSEQSKDIRGVA